MFYHSVYIVWAQQLLRALQFPTILHELPGRRKLIPVTQILITVVICAIKLIHHAIFEGMRIGRLHILDHDYGDAGLVQRIRAQLGEAAGGAASDTQESKVESHEKCVKMLLLNLRCYVMRIAGTATLFVI